jgi:hypothetical protein
MCRKLGKSKKEFWSNSATDFLSEAHCRGAVPAPVGRGDSSPTTGKNFYIDFLSEAHCRGAVPAPAGRGTRPLQQERVS